MSSAVLHSAPLTAWVQAVLEQAGVPGDHAGIAADAIVCTELRGVRTHGLARLGSYVEKIRAGEINASPTMTSERKPGVYTLDADGALGQVAAMVALREGMDMLASSPSVICRIRDCGHLGALGLYAWHAAEAGHMALVFQRTPPLMGLPGFESRAIGNNPIAFGCPIPGRAPLVFDMACSVAARGHILVAAREHQPIPDGWALDAHGHPTTDAEAALQGALMPMAGHKGLGLAMIAECLAGALAGGESESRQRVQATPRSGAAGHQSTLIWLVNPALAGDDTFAQYMREWAQAYRQRGGDAARIPGERADEQARAGREQGLRISDELARELDAVGQAAGLPVPFHFQ